MLGLGVQTKGVFDRATGDIMAKFYQCFANGRENLQWTGTRTRDLWNTVPVLSHLSYPAL